MLLSYNEGANKKIDMT